jgi:hypothetical protein
MSASLAITATKTRIGASLALTGGPTTAGVIFAVTHPGGPTQYISATTSGAGAVTVTCIPCDPGTISVSVSQPVAANSVVGPITAMVAA